MSKPTTSDVMGSITGFDEIAVARAFGADISALEKRPFTFLRALVFILKRREGLKDSEAKDFAMGLPLSEVNDYFADEEPDKELDDEADPKE